MLVHPRVRIDKSAFEHNVREIRERIGSALLWAVVKSNAYGHGIHSTVPILQELGVDGFAVATEDEAWDLLSYRPSFLMVLGPVEHPSDLLRSGVRLMATSIEAMEQYNENYPPDSEPLLHLRLDLGGDYAGLSMNEFARALMEYRDRIEGICAHFISYDIGGMKNMNAMFRSIVKGLDFDGLVHASHSAASLWLPEARYDACRVGMALYGYDPERGARLDYLKPTLSLEAPIIRVRSLDKETRCGYGGLAVLSSGDKIATVHIGYANGYPRLLKGGAQALLNGRRIALVGTVAMEHALFDVSDIENVAVGDIVTLVGENGGDSIWMDSLSSWGGIGLGQGLVNLSHTLPRELI